MITSLYMSIYATEHEIPSKTYFNFSLSEPILGCKNCVTMRLSIVNNSNSSRNVMERNLRSPSAEL